MLAPLVRRRGETIARCGYFIGVVPAPVAPRVSGGTRRLDKTGMRSPRPIFRSRDAESLSTDRARTELVTRTVTLSMRRTAATLGSAAFLALAPGTMAGLVPFLLTGWVTRHPPVVAFALGALLLAAGAMVLLHAFARFVVEGVGTPAPVAPTERLVVGGLYRYVRNPMYLAVTAAIVGQALVLGRPALLAYAAVFAAAVAAFVHGYEEPTLRRRYGAQYEEYCRA